AHLLHGPPGTAELDGGGRRLRPGPLLAPRGTALHRPGSTPYGAPGGGARTPRGLAAPGRRGARDLGGRGGGRPAAGRGAPAQADSPVRRGAGSGQRDRNRVALPPGLLGPGLRSRGGFHHPAARLRAGSAAGCGGHPSAEPGLAGGVREDRNAAPRGVHAVLRHRLRTLRCLRGRI
ncbi:MAG: hypothetical protein AVDCRST_MAG83-3738, partial [uncultured Arthrobacter sp.]